eukprot:TRINITY_DN49329_c0_g2_i1.p1 TRINITY_DN49329_c0_g2~~TRINITY_DN49329_c0_g2_i1.p1  ORF type:complete len:1221 (-),score=359.10 TRINITY_DN49329_c0_g2_i1:127-3789(-)
MSEEQHGAPSVPQQLLVSCPGAEAACGGTYGLLANESANGYPLWKCTESEHWLFSGPAGQWFIGDRFEKEDRFATNTGHVASHWAHGGVMPDKLAAGHWQRLDANDEWIDDPSIIISRPEGLDDVHFGGGDPKVPKRLKLANTTDVLIAGVYELIRGKLVNGHPIWKRRKGKEYWLFTGPSGQWFVGDEDEREDDFQCNTGYIASAEAHEGELPHEIQQGDWLRLDGSDWLDDAHVIFTEADLPPYKPPPEQVKPFVPGGAVPSFNAHLQEAKKVVAQSQAHSQAERERAARRNAGLGTPSESNFSVARSEEELADSDRQVIVIAKKYGLNAEQTKKIKQLFHQIDVDGSKSVTLVELQGMCMETSEVLPQAQLEKAFNELDQNSDGSVTIDEFIEMMASRLAVPIYTGSKLKCTWVSGVRYRRIPERSALSELSCKHGETVRVVKREDDWVETSEGWLPLHHVATGQLLFEIEKVDEEEAMAQMQHDFSLSQAQMSEIKATFDLYPKNDKGAISVEHLKQVLQRLGYPSSQADVESIMGELDLDKSGTIELWEFFTIMAKRQKVNIVPGAIIRCTWPSGVRYRRTKDRGDLLQSKVDYGEVIKVEDTCPEWVATPEGFLPIAHVASGKLLFEVLQVPLDKAGIAVDATNQDLAAGILPGMTLRCIFVGGILIHEGPSHNFRVSTAPFVQEGDIVSVLEREGLWIRADEGWLPLVHQATNSFIWEELQEEQLSDIVSDGEEPVVTISFTVRMVDYAKLLGKPRLRDRFEASLKGTIVTFAGLKFTTGDVAMQLRPGPRSCVLVAAVLRCPSGVSPSQIAAKFQSIRRELALAMIEQVHAQRGIMDVCETFPTIEASSVVVRKEDANAPGHPDRPETAAIIAAKSYKAIGTESTWIQRLDNQLHADIQQADIVGMGVATRFFHKQQGVVRFHDVARLEAEFSAAHSHCVCEAAALADYRQQIDDDNKVLEDLRSAGWVGYEASEEALAELSEAKDLRREAAVSAQLAVAHMEKATSEEAEAIAVRKEASSRLTAIEQTAKQVARMQLLLGMPEDGGMPEAIALDGRASPLPTPQAVASAQEVRRLEALVEEEVRQRVALQKECENLRQELRALSRMYGQRAPAPSQVKQDTPSSQALGTPSSMGGTPGGTGGSAFSGSLKAAAQIASTMRSTRGPSEPGDAATTSDLRTSGMMMQAATPGKESGSGIGGVAKVASLRSKLM